MPDLVASISGVKIATLFVVRQSRAGRCIEVIFPLRDSKKPEIGRDFFLKMRGLMAKCAMHRTLDFLNEALKLPIAL